MIWKDFENFELRLIKLQEESTEDFKRADQLFHKEYKKTLEDLFPRDLLWVKKSIYAQFCINHVDNVNQNNSKSTFDIFKQSIKNSCAKLHLSAGKKQKLIENILESYLSKEQKELYIEESSEIHKDPFFALVEDFSLDWEISREEFVILEHSYEKHQDFIKALDELPPHLKSLFQQHIEKALSPEDNSKKREFESEYGSELQILEQRGINIEPVIQFVSKSFYRSPGKLRKYEHPRRRLRRTFKIALLRLLRIKIWNISAKIMLEKFESCESFEDFFMLLFKLLEVINEDPKSEEVFSLLDIDEEVQDDVFTAEQTKKKILLWEWVVTKIASLFSKTDANLEYQELDEGILNKVLDASTDIVWDDIYFNREQENSWVYAELDKDDKDEDDEEDLDYDTMSPEVAYEILKKKFHDVEEKKRKAFGEWNYDDVDQYNEDLLDIEIKLWKISKILHLETE